jgi:hypothetical protein
MAHKISFWLLPPVLGLAACLHAHAATVTLDFDAPDFATGELVTQVGDINFRPGTVVFSPARVATFSGTQALKVASTCTTADCTNNAYRMDIRFGQPLPAPADAMLWRRAESVSLRVGADSIANSCLPEGTSCAIYARLSGWDANGNRVADSYDVFLLDATSLSTGGYRAPITREISIRDPLARIVRVALVYGKDTFNHDAMPTFPGEPQIDHLVVGFPDALPTDGAAPPPPMIQITAPVNGSQRSLPYQVQLQGSISVPGGLAAFCYRVNAPFPRGNDCRDNVQLHSDNTFNIAIRDSQLGPDNNTLAVTVYDLSGQLTTRTVVIATVPPPPPVVTVITPTNNQWITPSLTTALGGTVGTVGALKGFCVRIDATAVPAPETCVQDLDAIKSTNTDFQPLFFTMPLTPSRITAGKHHLAVFAVDRWNQVGRADLDISTPTDFRIVAMEITQGIQTFDLPLNLTGAAPYTGVKLRSNVPTIVRVFANTPFAGSYSGVRMLLNGFVPDARYGERPLGTVLPDSSPPAIITGPMAVPPSVRADPSGGYVFTLPNDWTLQSGLRLQAKLLLPFGAQECAACGGNNDFSVVSIQFEAAPGLKIVTVAIGFTDSIDGTFKTGPDPTLLFDPALTISPVPPSFATIVPYVGTLDVTDLVGPSGACGQWTTICEARIYSRMRIFESQHPQDGNWIGTGPVDVGYTVPPIGIADSRSPMIAVAHELYHDLNYFHASSCGVGANLFNMWPPDQKGFIHGVGLDRRKNLVNSAMVWTGRYKIMMPGSAGVALPFGAPTDYYDLMSYCASEDNAWISVENWNSFGGPFPNGLFPDVFIYGQSTATIRSAAQMQGQSALESREDSLLVNATLDREGRAQILQVARAGRKPVRAPSMSAYTAVARDSNRAEIARVPVSVQVNQGHGASAELLVMLTTLVPGRNAASIEIEHEGKVIGAIQRSKSAPSLELEMPDAARSTSRDRPLEVKWHAQDGDGDPLEVRIDFSPGPDQPFRPVFIGPNRGSWSVPGRLLSATTEGRLRLVVNDGFNESEQLIGPIRVDPVPPRLNILAPAAGISFPDSTPVHLRAEAFGDADTPLTGSALRWTLDGKAAGTGVDVELRNLKPGKHVATVVAHEGKLASQQEVEFFIRKDPRTPEGGSSGK